MMNFPIPGLPARTERSRNEGLTMVMDKGISAKEAENFLSSSAEYTDFVKLGFGSAMISNNLSEKLKIYEDAGIKTFFGGTLFEIFIVKGMFDDYRRLLDKFKVKVAEVSDGSINIPHEEKCRYIRTLSEQVTVISEIGSKDEDEIIPPYKWISLMQEELKAGSWKVVGEARESGNVGLFRSTGEVRQGLVQEILTQVPAEKIIWETPQKSQQVWFIRLLGPNVNLGNIAPSEVIALESLRLGLRGDTFFDFLPDDVAKKYNGTEENTNGRSNIPGFSRLKSLYKWRK